MITLELLTEILDFESLDAMRRYCEGCNVPIEKIGDREMIHGDYLSRFPQFKDMELD